MIKYQTGEKTMNTTEEWTKTNDEILKHWCKTGMAPSKVGAMVGLSRDAVIGHLARLGLVSAALVPVRYETGEPKRVKPSYPTPVRPKPSLAALKGKIAPQRSVPVLALVAPPADSHVDFAGLQRGMCKFPVNDTGTARFCGSVQGERQPYCDFHAGVAYTGVVRRPAPKQTTGFIRLSHMGGKSH